jgi:hypothetical protein
MLDADGSNDPAEIPRFLAPLRGGSDFVKGSRFMGRENRGTSRSFAEPATARSPAW